MFNRKIKFIIFALLLILITTSAFGCKNRTTKEEKEKLQPLTLNYWRVWDGADAFAEIIAKYNVIHPNVNIKYRKLRYEEYEKELVESFAEDRGPDIFSVHAGWMQRYKSKMAPIPPQITMAYPEIEGGLQPEVVVDLRTKNSITLKEMRDQYIETAYNNAVIDNKIYGLPLSVDTMVMFYNRDLINGAGIAEMPAYWDDKFLEDVKKLTKVNEQGKIIQAGTALGTSDNIERYSDILSLLMMQNGTQMMDANGNINFHSAPPGTDRNNAPGLEALRFYTDFANPVKEVYTWNSDMPNSLQAFAEGRLAIFFGYAYHIPMIKTRAPRLNFDIKPMLQIEGNVNDINFANFWLETVSNKSRYQPEAWDFLQFVARAENVASYLNKTKKPTALRALVEQQKANDELAAFAGQLLTARTWYQGKDYNTAEVMIGEMIDQALMAEEKELVNIINVGARKAGQTIK